MTYAADDQSIQRSAPVELYAFETPGTSWYLTTFNRDVDAPLWSNPATSQRYTATPGLSRSSLPVVSLGGVAEVSFDIPFEHPVAQLLLPGNAQRRYMLCTILRQQASGLLERKWQGYVTSANVTGRLCGIRVPDVLDDALDVDLPNASVSISCGHVLYDVNCRVLRAPNVVPTTMTLAAGVLLTVASVGGPYATPTWFVNGEVEHPASTERRTIVSHAGNVLTLDAPFPGAIWSGSVVVNLYPGCDHTMTEPDGCASKWNNRLNYGGHPQLPVSNPFSIGVGMASAVSRT